MRFRGTSFVLASVLAVACGGGDAFSTSSPDASAGAAGQSGSAGSAGSGGSDAAAGGGGTSGNGGTGGSTGTGGASGSGGSSASGGGVGDGSAGVGGGPDAGACDPAEQPIDGVFVSPNAAAGGDGSAALPFASIASALDAAASAGVHNVYLDQGTYAEPVDFKPAHAGITVRGGFTRTGAIWTRDCSSNARAKTVIASPAAVGVHVGQLAQAAGLRTLSVFTKATGNTTDGKPGESCYAIAVTGPGTELILDDVAATAGRGGAGGPTNAMVAAPAVTCGDPTGSCSDGASGSTGASAGATAPGVFTGGGWMPGNGKPGTPGGAGHDGTPGGAGAGATCYYSGCSGGSGTCAGHFCGDFGTHGVTAGHGTCGCGGQGGPAGGAGFGGGASVALLVMGSGSQIQITNSALVAKQGGDGSAGVAGESGEAGTPGAAGTPASCPGSCQSVDKGGGQCNCEQPSSYNLAGGAPGGIGGTGGPGGNGSGGAGGPSYAVVLVGGAVAALDSGTTTSADQGGHGANAPDGGSGSQLVVP